MRAEAWRRVALAGLIAMGPGGVAAQTADVFAPPTDPLESSDTGARPAAASARETNAAVTAPSTPQPTQPLGMAAQVPPAEQLIETHVNPAARRLADRALRLQNLVLRVCQGGKVAPRELPVSFARTVAAAAAFEPLAFGTPSSEDLPAALLTSVADTAFSSKRLKQLMNARTAIPPTLEALREEGAALVGLPALETLLLGKDYGDDETLQNRCRLAVPVAANVRRIAEAVEREWSSDELAAHWGAEPPELADRLRLRDLIQGMIDVMDRFERNLTALSEAGERPTDPFQSRALTLVYVRSIAAALLSQAEVLRGFAEPQSDPALLLEGIIATLAEAVGQLTEADEVAAVTLPPLAATRNLIAQRLPEAFGFAPTAFQQPLASFETER